MIGARYVAQWLTVVALLQRTHKFSSQHLHGDLQSSDLQFQGIFWASQAPGMHTVHINKCKHFIHIIKENKS